MARWAKVLAVLRNVNDQEKQESLGLPGFEVETIIKEIGLDLERIESYSPSIDDTGSEIEDEVDVITYSGLSMTLKCSFDELSRLLTNGNIK